MKAKEIKELINFISNSGLDEVNIETDEIKLHVKRQSEAANLKIVEQPVLQQSVAPTQIPATTQAPVQETASPSVETSSKTEESGSYVTIKSPMIGTFYTSPNPEADVFVKPGDSISKGKVVCIIEAMKLFNEIESEISGKIVKILAENASPVEYDQPLFLVDPS
ncbi:acetyl-CoA carboxylase biotin carboxyl carrier protein [Flexithrix dorotheae]|uniref:acetyl-CoA carboxylase biotin carboxyl carrier protein n=1 Tax=Flexithrix dorotheae TaxID=70993 RepID=UPI0003651F46|nr:acetyl-CoA carboxylase biotin carboxyl carrier protein [Flexithrix dorotheae]